MPKKTKQEPKVISYKKYKEDTLSLKIKVDNLKITLLEREAEIRRLQDKILIEIKANDNLRIEHNKAFETAKGLTFELNETQLELRRIRCTYNDAIIELKKEQTKSNCFKTNMIKFEEEITRLKARKWYHLLFKKRG